MLRSAIMSIENVIRIHENRYAFPDQKERKRSNRRTGNSRPALGNLHTKGHEGGGEGVGGPNTFKVTVLPLNLRLTIVLCL